MLDAPPIGINRDTHEPLVDQNGLYSLLPKRLRVPMRHAGIVLKNEVFTGQTLPPGVHWVWRIPFLQSVTTYVIDLRTRTEAFEFGRDLFTRDEQLVSVEIALTYHVSNPVQFALEMINPRETLMAKVKAAVGAALRGLESLEIFLAGQSLLQNRVLDDLRREATAVGFEMEGCDITEITLPKEIRTAYAKAIEKDRETKAEVERLKDLLLSGTSDLMLKEKVASSMMKTGLMPGTLMQFYTRELGGLMPGAGLFTAPNAPLLDVTTITPRASLPPPGAMAQTIIHTPEGARVCAMAGELAGRVFALSRAQTKIGRAPDNTIVLPPHDTAASRYHAVIRQASDQSIWIKNVTNANELLVDGENVLPQSERQLKQDNKISIGSTVLCVILRSKGDE